jgi:hypothetical protein
MIKDTKLFLVLLATFFMACDTTKQEQLSIGFSEDSSKVVISNIDEAGLKHLKDNLATDSNYQRVVSVLQTPMDDDSTSMEMEWPGKLTMRGNDLVFSPDTAFRKGKQYLVETILNSKFGTVKEIITSDVGHKVKWTQKTLVR